MVSRRDDNIIRYVNVESLCCTFETNKILYANYTLIFKNLESIINVSMLGRRKEGRRERHPHHCSLKLKKYAILMVDHLFT